VQRFENKYFVGDLFGEPRSQLKPQKDCQLKLPNLAAETQVRGSAKITADKECAVR
jgi:hypothetical protein